MTQLKFFSSICLQVFKIFVDFTLLHGEIGGDTRPLDIVGHEYSLFFFFKRLHTALPNQRARLRHHQVCHREKIIGFLSLPSFRAAREH